MAFKTHASKFLAPSSGPQTVPSESIRQTKKVRTAGESRLDCIISIQSKSKALTYRKKGGELWHH